MRESGSIGETLKPADHKVMYELTIVSSGRQ